MENKLQELTDKIYREGVSRGNEEAEKIISGAMAESERIIRQAEKEAKTLIADAEKKAEDLMEKTLSGMKMSFRNAMNALKQEVEGVITTKIVENPASEVFSDTGFIARVIQATAEKWAGSGNEQGIEISVPEEMKNEIEQYLKKGTSGILSKGITMRPVKSMEKGFEIKPVGKEYKISVTESDFANYLKEIMRPNLIDLLFEKNA